MVFRSVLVPLSVSSRDTAGSIAVCGTLKVPELKALVAVNTSGPLPLCVTVAPPVAVLAAPPPTWTYRFVVSPVPV